MEDSLLITIPTNDLGSCFTCSYSKIERRRSRISKCRKRSRNAIARRGRISKWLCSSSSSIIDSSLSSISDQGFFASIIFVSQTSWYSLYFCCTIKLILLIKNFIDGGFKKSLVKEILKVKIRGKRNGEHRARFILQIKM